MEAIIITLLLTIIGGAAGGGKWMLSVTEKRSEERNQLLAERINKFEKRIDKLFDLHNSLYLAFLGIKKEWDIEKEKEKRYFINLNKEKVKDDEKK